MCLDEHQEPLGRLSLRRSRRQRVRSARCCRARRRACRERRCHGRGPRDGRGQRRALGREGAGRRRAGRARARCADDRRSRGRSSHERRKTQLRSWPNALRQRVRRSQYLHGALRNLRRTLRPRRNDARRVRRGRVRDHVRSAPWKLRFQQLQRLRDALRRRSFELWCVWQSVFSHAKLLRRPVRRHALSMIVASLTTHTERRTSAACTRVSRRCTPAAVRGA